ncbi:hypothetical protein L1987_30614 [Smallanthus sonchifolius]|uniref:Uncharacterized protein n=1 Tax=Smallanthus sonchifolius TaxID=185202 RepID=A0ACB9I5Y9_9ASTR|nr:hypothetical protein L1987_30614 [Smallanthus sonchifolius]
MIRNRWCSMYILKLGWICGTVLIIIGWDPTVLIEFLEWGNNRENKSAVEILYNPYHTQWPNVSLLRVGWRVKFRFGRVLFWVRFWDRDGKGLGADITAFLSSDEGRYGEVIYWYAQDLKNGNHIWGLTDWASWSKDEKNRGVMSRVAGLLMEKGTECKLGLNRNFATGHKCHSDWANNWELSPTTWCLLGCSDRGYFWGLDIRVKTQVRLSQGFLPHSLTFYAFHKHPHKFLHFIPLHIPSNLHSNLPFLAHLPTVYPLVPVNRPTYHWHTSRQALNNRTPPTIRTHQPPGDSRPLPVNTSLL